MLDQLAYMLGGRAAEEMVFHDPTTGAGNDIEKATNLARAMVTQYGMTERLGAIKLGDSNCEPFLGRDMGHQRNYSEDVAAIVDEETKKLLAAAHQEAFDILEENRDVLDALVLALLDKETLDKAEIAEIFEALRRRPARPAWTGSPDRQPLDDPAGGDPRRRSASGPRQRHQPPAVDAGAGAVVTPPGAGGDVHGGPGCRRCAGRPGQPTGPGRRRLAPRRHVAPVTDPITTLSATRPDAGVRPRPRRGRRARAAAAPSGRTPTARACSRRRPGWRGPTPS